MWGDFVCKGKKIYERIKSRHLYHVTTIKQTSLLTDKMYASISMRVGGILKVMPFPRRIIWSNLDDSLGRETSKLQYVSTEFVYLKFW